MIYLSILVFLLGLSLGSFANCLIWRLYQEEKILGRSYCPKCKHKIAWYDNIPLLSYFYLRGNCRHCGKRISIQYPIIELSVALLFLFFWWQQFDFTILSNIIFWERISSASFWLYLSYIFLAVWTLVIIFIFDLRYYLVSTLLVWPATIFFFIINLIMGVPWFDLLMGMVVGGLFFLIQYLLTRGKGLGEGDIYLGVLLGSIFSFSGSLFTAIFIAYILGTIIAILLIIFNKKNWGSKLPLGVFLSLGAIIALILKQDLFSLFGIYL